MARSRPSFLKLRKIIGRPALRPWFLIYWFLIKEGGVYVRGVSDCWISCILHLSMLKSHVLVNIPNLAYREIQIV